MKKELLLSGVLGGLLGAIIVIALQRTVLHPLPPVATVNVEDVVTAEIKRLQSEGMNATDAETHARQWGPRFDSVLNQMAADYGVVLLVRPSVAAGAPDLTLELKRRMEFSGLRSEGITQYGEQ